MFFLTIYSTKLKQKLKIDWYKVETHEINIQIELFKIKCIRFLLISCSM